ncbi:PIG-L family deacetylase [Variibacter gotjawalensis]|uniref:PIG-L deacetylase family protein n=1 Tax=Variibacter gotjawalensis TaxID=1333996 RepID=UPI000BBAF5CD
MGRWRFVVVRARSLPILLSDSFLRNARWLVIAPHPDDETLGAGALIADTASRKKLAGVAILTNGEGSHHHVNASSRARLVAMRRREAAAALRYLAPSYSGHLTHLGWPDARPLLPATADYASTVRRLAAICRAHHVNAIAVTAAHEPHCDHQAAFSLALDVVRSAGCRIVLAEYLVWATSLPAQPHVAVRTAAMNAGRRKMALAAHRSQMSPAFGDGFRISPEKARMSASDVLYTRAIGHEKIA